MKSMVTIRREGSCGKGVYVDVVEGVNLGDVVGCMLADHGIAGDVLGEGDVVSIHVEDASASAARGARALIEGRRAAESGDDWAA